MLLWRSFAILSGPSDSLMFAKVRAELGVGEMTELPGEGEPQETSAPDPMAPMLRSQPRNYNELIARLGEESTPTPSPPPLTPSAPPPPAPPTVPAGWYPDPDNTSGFRYGSTPSMRYFDGTQWTEQRAPMHRPQQQRGPYPPQPLIVNQQFAPQPTVVVNSGSSSMVGLHIVLTILTCGLWLPFWVLIEIVQAISRR